MMRQYHAHRRRGGDNPLGVGTIALGAVFHLQDDTYWRCRHCSAPVLRVPWIVEALVNGEYHAAHRDPDTGRWRSVFAANRTDLAVVRSLRDGRRREVAICLLQLHEEHGFGWPCNAPPGLPGRAGVGRSLPRHGRIAP